MVITRLPSLTYVGVISCLAVSVSVGCRQSSETASEPDVVAEESISAPTEATALETTQDQPLAEEGAIATAPEASTSADPVDASETAISDEASASSERQCSASAYVADTDPAGLNVRNGPGSDFEVIDTLSTDGPVEVTIIGSANGWLKLDVAWSLEQQELEEPGWVFAPLLGVTTRNSDIDNEVLVPLFTDPDATAGITAELPKFAEVSLLSCANDWLQVQSGETTGWLGTDNQCSSPVTTCP